MTRKYLNNTQSFEVEMVLAIQIKSSKLQDFIIILEDIVYLSPI